METVIKYNNLVSNNNAYKILQGFLSDIVFLNKTIELKSS